MGPDRQCGMQEFCDKNKFNMTEMIKYVAMYGGPVAIAFALLVYLLKDILIQKLLSRLTPEHSYKVVMRLMFFGFFICLLIVMGFYFMQVRNNSQPVTKIGFKCGTVQETVHVIKKISSARNQLDGDDLLVLNAIEEKFLQYQKINPECEIDLINGIRKEIQQAESILKKYANKN
jgi:hypothetical protein